MQTSNPDTLAGRPRLPRWAWLPIGLVALLLIWIVGVRVLLRRGKPERHDFASSVRAMTAPGTGMRVIGLDPMDSTVRILRAESNDTVMFSPEDYRHQRMRMHSHDGREAMWYLRGSPDLFGNRFPPGDDDVAIQDGGSDNAEPWVPRYPSARAQPGSAERRNGERFGGWTFESPDSLARVVRFYEQTFRDSGFTVGTQSAWTRGEGNTSEIRAQSGDGRRQAIVALRHLKRGTTYAELSWHQKP